MLAREPKTDRSTAHVPARRPAVERLPEAGTPASLRLDSAAAAAPGRLILARELAQAVRRRSRSAQAPLQRLRTGAGKDVDIRTFDQVGIDLIWEMVRDGEIELSEEDIQRLDARERELGGPGVPLDRTGSSMRIYGARSAADFETADPEFAALYGAGTDEELVVAVVDTGIDTTTRYLGGHTTARIDTTGAAFGSLGGKEPTAYLHGTRVAGQAAFGTDKIKLIDVRVQVIGQGRLGPGIITLEAATAVAAAIRRAIEHHHARVVTASVILDWGHAQIQSVVRDHPEVVFLTTAGNSKAELRERLIDAGGTKGNALLVGGVTMEGGVHPKRGYGPAVDVTMPSGSRDDDEGAVVLFNPASAAALIGYDASQITADAVTSGDSGVSFGIPVLANLIAKMLLLNPRLSGAQAVNIIKATQDRGTKMPRPLAALAIAKKTREAA